MKHLATFWIALAALAAPALAAQPFYVVRHLQKAPGEDPPLTAEGKAFARALAEQLGDEDIRMLFATATRRAQETAAPLAARLNLKVTTYDPADAGSLIRAAKAAGGAVMIVGHSNTVPDIVEHFGAARPGPIADDEYGTIYIVEPGSREVRTMKVGAAPKGERG